MSIPAGIQVFADKTFNNLKILNSLTISATATLTINGTVVIAGALTISGNITSTGTNVWSGTNTFSGPLILSSSSINITGTIISNVTITKTGSQLNFNLNRATNGSADLLNYQTGGATEWSLGTPSGDNYLFLSQSGTAVNKLFLMTLGTGRLAVQGSGGITRLSVVNALNATGTLTAAMMRGGIVTSTTGAAVVATTDTAALIVAAFPQAAVNETVEFTVHNTGGNSFTVAGGAGVTVVGTAAIATVTSRLVKLHFTNVGSGTEAVTVYL